MTLSPPALSASVSAEERAYIDELTAQGGLPFAVTSHFAFLAGPEPDDPIRRQFMPDPREAQCDPFALEDPLGEACHRATPRLIHQYADRALLKTTAHCGGFCRFCFRRVWVAETARGEWMAAPFITTAELEPVLAYLKDHPEIREILISGGDPLTASDERLEWLFQGLREARPNLRTANPALSLRICTRLPITAPDRITRELIDMLRRFSPLRMAVHINHPRELSPESRRALTAIVEAGIHVLVQTVLLKGVNDNAATLAALFRECRDLGLIPYYLFQLDLAPGTTHFRVPLKQGLALYRELQETLVPALAGTELKDDSSSVPLIPAYAVDLPGGGGKIRLSEESIAGEEERPEGRVYLLKDRNGKLWPYPAE
ncbi:KamA family radical SAM protein [Spirochaetia bacterium]|nr:KamA family radical SAM protein [Spirochaetia bacterium]